MNELRDKVLKNISKDLMQLDREGISFFNHEVLNNIVFYSTSNKSGKVFEISNHCFYGYSRLAYITEFPKEGYVKLTKVTDQDYFNNYMKPIIVKQLM